MKQNFTHDLLVLHAYNETSKHDKKFLAKELLNDEILHDELSALIQTKRMLTGKMMSPSQTSVRLIMEHSFKTEHLQEI